MKNFLNAKRNLEVVVISDVHPGSYGCHAAELVMYLRSIQTGLLIINGDFIDIWNFNKRYFPSSHMLVIKEVMNMLSNGYRYGKSWLYLEYGLFPFLLLLL